MGTTVWVDDEVRAELRRLQASFGAASVNETLRRLINQPAGTAADLFTRHRAGIARVEAKYGLVGLTAFGSRARGDARPDSDLDLSVDDYDRTDPLALLRAEQELEALLGVKVAIVERPAALAAVIDREGVPFGS